MNFFLKNIKRISHRAWVYSFLSLLAITTLVVRWSWLDIDFSQFASLENIRWSKSVATFGFLIWNLFLAWVPFWLASIFGKTIKAGSPLILSFIIGLAWLAFLPNAPYIITDFVHLKWRHPVPHWYDLMVLFVFAWTGLSLGFESVRRMHQSIQSIAGNRWANLIAFGSLALCGPGVYLGRVLRYNSWDLLHEPVAIAEAFFSAILFPLDHPGASMAWILSGFLCLAYLAHFHKPLKSVNT